MTNYRPLSKKSRDKLTPEQLAERKREMTRLRLKRYRTKLGRDGRRKVREREDARCYDWAVILPLVDKDPETGCWIWQGPFKSSFGLKVRPLVRQGTFGKQYADHVVACLHRGKPLPPRCYLTRSCGRIDCVSPEHILVTNHCVERAKRRLAHEQEEKRERRAG